MSVLVIHSVSAVVQICPWPYCIIFLADNSVALGIAFFSFIITVLLIYGAITVSQQTLIVRSAWLLHLTCFSLNPCNIFFLRVGGISKVKEMGYTVNFCKLAWFLFFSVSQVISCHFSVYKCLISVWISWVLLEPSVTYLSWNSCSRIM